MLFKLIVAILGGWLAVFGWDEFSMAYNNSEPTKMTCANFIADPKKPKWVSVDDCVIYFGKFEYTHTKGSEKIDDAGVLVYASMKEAETDASKTSVVIQVSNQTLLEKASKDIDLINATNKKIDDISGRLNDRALPKNQRSPLIAEAQTLEKEAERMRELLFVKKPMVLKFSSMRPQYDLLKSALEENYDVYEVSSADDKPSYLMAVLKMIGGLVLILGVVYSFIPGAKKADN